jgi:hypothetical protein
MDVVIVIAEVAAQHHNDPLTGTCRTCSFLAEEFIAWMCPVARVTMALATVMSLCDDSPLPRLIRTDQLRSLIAGAVNYVPEDRR